MDDENITDNENITGNTYDKYASTNFLERRMMAGFFDALDVCLTGLEPATVVEVGAGEGHVTGWLRTRFPGAAVVGLDLPDASLREHWRAAGVPMFFGDAPKLPFPDRSIDLV
ncbi:MAG: class I SAM-dependent methyltransferase, partial [Ilumatobacteraceae bacterium]